MRRSGVAGTGGGAIGAGAIGAGAIGAGATGAGATGAGATGAGATGAGATGAGATGSGASGTGATGAVGMVVPVPARSVAALPLGRGLGGTTLGGADPAPSSAVTGTGRLGGRPRFGAFFADSLPPSLGRAVPAT